MDKQSRRMQACVRKVLSELEPWALLCLKDPKLEVVVLPEDGRTVWSHFPVRRNRYRGPGGLGFHVDIIRAARGVSAIREGTWTAEDLEKSEDLRQALRFFLDKRLIAQGVRLKSQTRVLLVFSAAEAEKESRKLFEDQIRDHLGHVLLYLRSPRAHNGCPEAMKEWRKSVLRRAVATPTRRQPSGSKRPGEKTRWKQRGGPSKSAPGSGG